MGEEEEEEEEEEVVWVKAWKLTKDKDEIFIIDDFLLSIIVRKHWFSSVSVYQP